MPRILVAGVGNIFRGDDAFGVEVVRTLAARGLPNDVRVVDFGIRGHDLAYALLDGYDGAVLIDAARRGGRPGTLYLIEPDARPASPLTGLDSHSVCLPAVFELVRLMNGRLPPMRLIGCEPQTLGTEQDGAMGLSEPVAAAVEPAADLVARLIDETPWEVACA